MHRLCRVQRSPTKYKAVQIEGTQCASGPRGGLLLIRELEERPNRRNQMSYSEDSDSDLSPSLLCEEECWEVIRIIETPSLAFDYVKIFVLRHIYRGVVKYEQRHGEYKFLIFLS